MSVSATLFDPLHAVAKTLSHLTRKQKFAIGWISLSRVMLTALDLAGLALVGVVVSIVAGTKIDSQSAVGTALAWLRTSGFPNGYAVLAAAAILFFVIKGLFSVALNYTTSSYLAVIEARQSKEILNRILARELSATDGLSRTDILYGLTHSTNVVFAQTLTIATALVGEVALLVGVSTYLAISNPLLFLVVATFFGAVGLGMQYFMGPTATRIGRVSQRAQLGAQNAAMDALENFQQIRVVGNRSYFSEKFGEDRSTLAKQSAKTSTLISLPRYVTEISVMVGVGLLILLRSNESLIAISAPTIAIFLVGIFRIVAAMLPIQSGLTALGKNRPETSLAYELMERATTTAATALDKRCTHPHSAISFESVDFGYAGAASSVINQMNLQIQPGEFIAIIGTSGQGKSTLANLLLGLRRPQTGEVFVQGVPAAAFLTHNPGYLAYVPQRVNLLEDTLRQNILLGRDNNGLLDDAALVDILDKLSLGALLESLPQGLDTVMGEKSFGLSGGQIQRIGLARALAGQPKILVLDESTSALDQETAKSVSSLVNANKGRMTIVAIAHQPETISAADKVYRLESGSLSLVNSAT